MAGSSQKISDQVTFFSKTSLKSVRRLAEEALGLEEVRLIFGYYIAEKCVIHFPSPRGVGKSWFAMQLCIAVAGEWPSFLGETINHHGHTLYINNELRETVIQRRSKKLMDHVPYSLQEKYKALVFTSRNSLAHDLASIVQVIEKYQPVLIVVDNLRMAFMDSDTNSNREMVKLMFTLVAICEATNTSILITDHFRKHTSSLLSDSDLQTGSGVKTDLSDGDFFLRKSNQDKNLRILKRGKSRHFEEAEGAKLIRLNPETMWFELVADEVNEAEHIGIQTIKDKEEQKDIAKSLRDQGKTFDEIARILGKGKATIHRWLNAQVVEENNKSPP